MPYANPEDARRHRLETREQRKAYDKRYYLENREKIRVRKRATWKPYYVENREKIIQRAVEWNKANPEQAAVYKKAWAEAHPDYKREWYLANRERVLEQTKAGAKRRFEEDPERIRAMQRNTVARRRAKQREAHVENVDPRMVWNRDGGVCGICGEPAEMDDWHLDHIVPIVRGGEHSYANVQVAHPLCNWRKAAS
jgi:HNH endonuclease